MTNDRRIVLERSYEAPLEDLWDLWTTKEGFEAWWGPEGFRVVVHAIDARVGGELNYDMVAAAPEMIEYMKSQGQAVSHGTRGTFVEVQPLERLVLEHVIDFIPGVETYPHRMSVEFSRNGDTARMVITIDPHVDEEWTRKATQGMESQLTKVPAVLAARR